MFSILLEFESIVDKENFTNKGIDLKGDIIDIGTKILKATNSSGIHGNLTVVAYQRGGGEDLLELDRILPM